MRLAQLGRHRAALIAGSERLLLYPLPDREARAAGSTNDGTLDPTAGDEAHGGTPDDTGRALQRFADEREKTGVAPVVVAGVAPVVIAAVVAHQYPRIRRRLLITLA